MVDLRRLIAINALIRVASAATGQIIAFIVAAQLADRLGAAAGAVLVGILAASFYVTELLVAPIAGRVADRRGQLKVLRWGPAVGAVSAVAAAAVSFGHWPVVALAGGLLVARVLEGLSAAFAVPTTLALLATGTEKSDASRLRVMGAFEVASLVGLIGGYVGAGVMWDALGASALLVFAGVYAFAWLLVPTWREVTSAQHRVLPLRETLTTLATTPGVPAFIIAWLAVNAVVGVWAQQAPFLMKLPVRSASQALVGGYSGTNIGYVFGVWAAVFLVGIALWSLFAAQWPRRRTLLVALCGMLTVVIALALVNHGVTHWLLALGMVGVLVESGFTPAAFAHMADITDVGDASRGMTMGIYSMLLGTGQLAGAVLGAPLAAALQMDGVLMATAGLALVAMIAVGRMPQSIVGRPASEPGRAQGQPEQTTLP
ncbi:MAG: MFS transporter [Gemmatimonadaceae bacterium]